MNHLINANKMVVSKTPRTDRQPVVNEGIATNENTRLRERNKQLEEERDAMMADLLLWRETVEAKP